MQPVPGPVAEDIGDALPNAIDPFALSLNENPFPPLPAVRSALIRSVYAANRYPEFLPERLRGMIAAHVGVPADWVVPGAGATGLALQTLQALTSPGDTIAMALPTFDGYPIVARMARLNSLIVPLDGQGHNDLDALADAAADARVVVLCRPHNPTGTLEPVAEVLRFLGRVPRDTVVLLDEAYIEFTAPEHRIDLPALLVRFPNVVVIRTFSKAYGLAGLRIGYGVASPDLASRLWAQQLPFGVAITGLLAVAASYGAEDELRQRVRAINAERRHLRMRLSAMGIYTTDSHANFLYLPLGAAPWQGVFADGGLHVRHYPDGGARITVGNRASTLAVLSALGKATRQLQVR
ncbi:histidinol-phosphate aminotransferase [Mycobacterium bohemicum DSM 44277]|uniref:Aminotransferase n=2 Tax=Mycobacterium bohemicum TaxID=56425 RepID=A0A1X1RBT0_MYCBE|nr:aminotransferase class I/II-fold pyridoxal phosphate-dependent enzyme [Mycobacterium bohemicum]MCV6969715.1 aminotransferase class I/II-fold pyridoxal phosphate-dependent enzyme [Mycobacterium bohemicum]ORV02718.1 aminotransferase [Mycobacterium bohemicum]CPR13419.1 histidinol-phosphate aminotransferase [Mycobacterium bohemicum DSM 44277]